MWNSRLSRKTCQDIIAEDIALVPVFRFVSKLSAGGVVTRVLQAPYTELPFWGKVQDDMIRMVQNIPSEKISPYQPIIQLQLQEKEQGTEIFVLLRPHKQASMFAIFELIGAVLCITAGLLAISQSPLGGVTIVFGILLALFPWLRARRLFAFEKNRCLHGLEELKSKLQAERLETSEKTG